MDENQGLTPARFLDLLNNGNRTPAEEQELQTELKRQQEEKIAAQKAAEAQIPENMKDVPAEQAAPAQPEVPADQPVNEAQPENVAPQDSQVQQEEEQPYSLSELVSDTQNAIAYLEGLEQTEQIQHATAAYKQGAYLVSLVNK